MPARARNDSEVGDDGSITCRWHESCFDLDGSGNPCAARCLMVQNFFEELRQVVPE